MYHRRMSRKLNRSLDEQDVITLITKKSLFDSYRFSEDCRADMYDSCVDMYASAAERIPSFEEMVDAGVFYLD